MSIKSSLAVVFVVIASAGAVAQTASTPAPAAPSSAVSTAPDTAGAKIRVACATDVQTFCATAPKGKGMMRACLDTHAADLSASCKSARAERAALKK